jgi:hypothetical protein
MAFEREAAVQREQAFGAEGDRFAGLLNSKGGTGAGDGPRISGRNRKP